jgi:hypothetical protein
MSYLIDQTIVLEDIVQDEGKVEVQIFANRRGIELYPKGYGENEAIDGSGSPVLLELCNGKLRVVVSDDINDPDKQVIDLEGAREDKRNEE